MNFPASTMANLTCPHCGHEQEAAMPTDSCVPFFVCRASKKMLKAKNGDCCVFCSYGIAPVL
jgi:hypothetical protein